MSTYRLNSITTHTRLLKHTQPKQLKTQNQTSSQFTPKLQTPKIDTGVFSKIDKATDPNTAKPPHYHIYMKNGQIGATVKYTAL